METITDQDSRNQATNRYVFAVFRVPDSHFSGGSHGSFWNLFRRTNTLLLRVVNFVVPFARTFPHLKVGAT